jgi:hypothetical protein
MDKNGSQRVRDDDPRARGRQGPHRESWVGEGREKRRLEKRYCAPYRARNGGIPAEAPTSPLLISTRAERASLRPFSH